MAYELEALEKSWRLAMHDSDWERLVGLAHRYGWRPAAGLDHYLREGTRLLPPSEAKALAGALEGALQNLPPERRRGSRPIVGALGDFVGETPPKSGPDADYEVYFSWGRRWIVEEVMRLCRQGAVEIRPM